MGPSVMEFCMTCHISLDSDKWKKKARPGPYRSGQEIISLRHSKVKPLISSLKVRSKKPAALRHRSMRWRKISK